MKIEEIEREIVEEFSICEDWMDKYAYLIELGKELTPMDETHKTEDNLIRGCQSRVWFHADYRDGLLYFSGDSDAIITKGLVALMLRVFSGHKPEDIVRSDISFIDTIGLSTHLSPTRSNGLLAMLKQIKYYGLAYSLKKE